MLVSQMSMPLLYSAATRSFCLICFALRIRSTFAPTMLREPIGTLRGFDTGNTSIYKVYEASDLI